MTRRIDEEEFREDTFFPLRGNGRDAYAAEMNRVISEKALQGQNGLIRERYVTISLQEENCRRAQVRLIKRAEDIQSLFKRMGSSMRVLSGLERLNLLHGITIPNEVILPTRQPLPGARASCTTGNTGTMTWTAPFT